MLHEASQVVRVVREFREIRADQYGALYDAKYRLTQRPPKGGKRRLPGH